MHMTLIYASFHGMKRMARSENVLVKMQLIQKMT